MSAIMTYAQRLSIAVSQAERRRGKPLTAIEFSHIKAEVEAGIHRQKLQDGCAARRHAAILIEDRLEQVELVLRRPLKEEERETMRLDMVMEIALSMAPR